MIYIFDQLFTNISITQLVFKIQAFFIRSLFMLRWTEQIQPSNILDIIASHASSSILSNTSNITIEYIICGRAEAEVVHSSLQFIFVSFCLHWFPTFYILYAICTVRFDLQTNYFNIDFIRLVCAQQCTQSQDIEKIVEKVVESSRSSRFRDFVERLYHYKKYISGSVGVS